MFWPSGLEAYSAFVVAYQSPRPASHWLAPLWHAGQQLIRQTITCRGAHRRRIANRRRGWVWASTILSRHTRSVDEDRPYLCMNTVQIRALKLRTIIAINSAKAWVATTQLAVDSTLKCAAHVRHQIKSQAFDVMASSFWRVTQRNPT